MLRRVALVRTDVSEELSASIIRAIRIGELGTTLAVSSNRRTQLTFLYVDDVRTSQETHPYASTACYGDTFTFLRAPVSQSPE
jgi:hypothetical protein